LVDFNALRSAFVFGNDVMISFVKGRIKAAKELCYTEFAFMMPEIDCRVKYYWVLIGIAKKISTPQVSMEQGRGGLIRRQ